MARLLFPSDFGLMAMVAVFASFGGLFTELGMGAAIVHRSEIRTGHLYTAFWVNLLMGAGLAVLMAASAPLIAGFYGEPTLIPLTLALSINFVLYSGGVVQRALLVRDLAFRQIAFADVMGVLLGGVAGVSAAAFGLGVFSLVIQILASTAVTSLSLWLMNPWRPSVGFERECFQHLWDFGSHLTGFKILNYWSRSADDLLVGRFVGSEALGLYTKAYNIMLLPVSKLSGVIGQVMFPTLSKVQDDRERVRRVYLRAIGAIALLSFPMVAGFFAVIPNFVLGVLGPRWAGLIPVLQVLVWVGLLQSIGTTTGWIYQSQGHTRLMFRWGTAFSIFTIAAFAVGVNWGVMGVAVAYLMRTIVVFVANMTVAGALINIRFGDVVRRLAAAFVLAVLMSGVVASGGLLLADQMGHLPVLILQVILGIAVYVTSVVLVDLDSYRDLRRVLGEQFGQTRSGRQS